MTKKHYAGDPAHGYVYRASFSKDFYPIMRDQTGEEQKLDYSKWEARIIQFDTDDEFWNELVEFSDGAIEDSIGCSNGVFWTQVKLFDKKHTEEYHTAVAFEGDILLKRRYGPKRDRISLIHKNDIRNIYWVYCSEEGKWVGEIQTWGMLGRLEAYNKFKTLKNCPAMKLKLMLSYYDGATIDSWSDRTHNAGGK